MTPDLTPSAWEEAGLRFRPDRTPSLWRTFCDGLNQEWLRRLLGTRRWKAALKTDAFDEAAGDGVFPVLDRAAAQTLVMDASLSMCRLAGLRYPSLRTVACDTSRLPFGGGSFDLIVSISTLDHFASLEDLSRALDCLHRVMRPGGCLFLTLDNLDNPVVRLRNALPWGFLNRLRLVPFPVGATVGSVELRRLLTQAGFEVLKTSTLMHIPRAPAVALAAVLNGARASRLGRLFRQTCMGFEALAKLPTARWTANYIAAVAVKSAQSNGSSTLRS